MLKALQMRTNRVAFSDASVSSVPAMTLGLVRDDPDAVAVDTGEAGEQVRREELGDPRNAPSSNTFEMTSRMS